MITNFLIKRIEQSIKILKSSLSIDKEIISPWAGEWKVKRDKSIGFKKDVVSNWEECEVIATIYAVWNNRLLKDEAISDDFLFEDFMAWSSRKSNFKNDFYKKLFWMKDENIIPNGNGWGNYIDRLDKKMA